VRELPQHPIQNSKSWSAHIAHPRHVGAPNIEPDNCGQSSCWWMHRPCFSPMSQCIGASFLHWPQRRSPPTMILPDMARWFRIAHVGDSFATACRLPAISDIFMAQPFPTILKAWLPRKHFVLHHHYPFSSPPALHCIRCRIPFIVSSHLHIGTAVVPHYGAEQPRSAARVRAHFSA